MMLKIIFESSGCNVATVNYLHGVIDFVLFIKWGGNIR